MAPLIRNAINFPGADQHKRVCGLNFKLQTVATNIRNLPGLSCFLPPSLFRDLQRAAIGGPVIIVNASKYSCDALIVFLDLDPVHIPLQIIRKDVRDLSKELLTLTVRAKTADVVKELAFFLHRLWDQTVSPIVDCLKTTHPSQSCIWWYPTAGLSVLLLHAAGPCRKGQQNSLIFTFPPTSRPSPPSFVPDGAIHRLLQLNRSVSLPSVKPKHLARANSFPSAWNWATFVNASMTSPHSRI